MLKAKEWNVLLVGVLILILCSLAACSEEVIEEKLDDPLEANGEKKSEESKYGGTIAFATNMYPDSFDPHRSQAVYTHLYAGVYFSKLVTYKTGPDLEYNDYEVSPDLADSWNVSDDGLVYTFHLREAYWHDIEPVNCRQIVAEDVVVTMKRIQTLPAHQVSYLASVENIEAEDEQTVVFTLKEPFTPFLSNIANHYMWILPKEGIEGQYDLSTTPIGSGPFVMEDLQENVQMSFTRNPEYFEKGKPYLDRVEFFVTPEQTGQIAAYRTGKTISVGSLSPETLDSVLKSNRDSVVSEMMSGTHVYVHVNMEREPFNDLRVRKAISMAINRENLAEQIYGSGEVSGPINPSLGDWAIPLQERSTSAI